MQIPDPHVPYVGYVDCHEGPYVDAHQWALAPAQYWKNLSIVTLEKRPKPLIGHVLIRAYRNKEGYWDRELRLTFTQDRYVIERF